jgi:hypothetical protein
MRRASSSSSSSSVIATLLLAIAIAVAVPAAPAAAKGMVGMSVCGANGCVDRSNLIGRPGSRQANALLDMGPSVADPGQAPFLRVKMHIGDGGQHFGTETLIYLPGLQWVRSDNGTWYRLPAAAAATLRRAARGVPTLPAPALRPFRPSPAVVAEVVATPPAPAAARTPAPTGGRGSDGGPGVGLLGGIAAAIALAAAAGVAVRMRRGRPATG